MPRKRKKSTSKTGKRYKKLVIIFASFTLALFVLIAYFALSRTTIDIHPKTYPIDLSADLTVKEKPSADELKENVLPGYIAEKIADDTITASDLGEGQEIEDYAQGTVTIFNNWSFTQPLSATTRLLSQDGVLFRTKSRIDVPAKGKIEAEVIADQKGISGNIGPTRFAIVALSKELQEKIYAESTETMTGGTKKVMRLTEDMVLKFQNQLIDEMKETNKASLQESVANFDNKLYLDNDSISYQILDKNVTPAIDEDVSELKVTLKLKFLAVGYDKNILNEIIKKELNKKLGSDMVLDEDSIEYSYTIGNVNPTEKTSIIKVNTAANKTIDPESNIFDKKNLTGKNRDQIIKYFQDFEDIDKVEVRFSPFWVFKSPNLESYIKLNFIK